MQNRKRNGRKRTNNSVSIHTIVPQVDFNKVRSAIHRYELNSDVVTSVSRASLLSMKVCKETVSSTSPLVPCFTAVRLRKVVVFSPPNATKSPPGRFTWDSENSNGIDHKIPTGNEQISRTVLVPNGRAALWSNANSSSLTLGEALFTLQGLDGSFLDIHFDYVETSGLATTLTGATLGTISVGVVYSALDSHIAGALTVGNWFLEPVVDTSQKVKTSAPTVFTRA